MLLPPTLIRLTLVALLTGSAIAEARPAVAVVRREQLLVLSESPALGALELRVAPGTPTLVRFDAEVARVEPAREGFERGVWMEVARHVLVLEPRRALEPEERLSLEVRFKQGTVPSRLVLHLVTQPDEVDSRVEVELRPRLPAGKPEAASPQKEGGLLSALVLSGILEEKGVTVIPFDGKATGTGVIAILPMEYRAARERAIAFQVDNPAGAKPWSASEVVLLSPPGTMPVKKGRWTVHMEAPIPPGASGRVVVVGVMEETDAPLRLEVKEQGGSRSVLLERP